jgi:hypothetical protein
MRFLDVFSGIPGEMLGAAAWVFNPVGIDEEVLVTHC